MILSKYVNIKISNNQIRYYRDKGYDVSGGNEIKEILVSDLPNNSSVKIRVGCDICGFEKDISLSRYVYNTKNFTTYYACSRKCAEDKNKDTVYDKYGVKNISISQSIKDKKVDTCLKNFGVEYPQQSDVIFNKSKSTKFDKYGDENYNNLDKSISTNLERYGTEFVSQNFDIAKKMKENQFLSYKKDFDNNLYKSEIIRNRSDIFINYKSNGQYEFKCDLHLDHNFTIDYKLLWNRINSETVLCTICNPISKNVSGLELQLLNFIRDNYDGVILFNDRTLLKNSELDIYIPDLKLAFEFNGLWWHNELYKDKYYHCIKTDECEKRGVQLIHIYEDDWLYKQDIVKSIISNKLGRTKKIYARCTEVSEVNDINVIKNFLEKNHLQGYVGSKIKIGLFHNGELISLMTFGSNRIFMGLKSKNKDDYELLRFCNKIGINIVGGASKLFTYFIKKYAPNEIITYADRSFSKGDLYDKLGFKYLDKTGPNYYYIIDGIRKYRFGFRKNKLVSQGYDRNKTEHEIMLERNVYRIYNSGNLKFIYKNKIN